MQTHYSHPSLSGSRQELALPCVHHSQLCPLTASPFLYSSLIPSVSLTVLVVLSLRGSVHCLSDPEAPEGSLHTSLPQGLPVELWTQMCELTHNSKTVELWDIARSLEDKTTVCHISFPAGSPELACWARRHSPTLSLFPLPLSV
jgi:hypothetical protein